MNNETPAKRVLRKGTFGMSPGDFVIVSASMPLDIDAQREMNAAIDATCPIADEPAIVEPK